MLLAKNRTAFGAILIPKAELENRESPILFAAKELRYYLDLITAASFSIEEDDGRKNGVSLSFAAPEKELGNDGFTLESTENRLSIEGGKRGVLYGSYEFLERLGCRFFTHNCEKVPTVTELELPELHERQKPILEYREHNYADAVQSPKFSLKCRFNGSFNRLPEKMGGHMPYAWFVHSFDTMVPASVYGKDHPEYFSLINGKRNTNTGGRTQLCLTNPEVLELCIEAARKQLQAHPEAKIISISQNDWHDNCQCEKCRAVDQEEGSPAGTLLRFVNALAERLEPEFPDVIFDTLSYHYSRPAPKITRNRKNVCVRLCSIECCFAHSFEACNDESRSVKRPDGSIGNFITDLRNWGKICDRMYIWDYTTSFAHYPAPHPNWRVLQPNIQTMVENNVKGVFEQANGASRGGVDFNELRMYLISKLLWDPYCDIEKHRREFMEYYYGAAAGPLDRYLNLLCDKVEKDNIHVGFNDNLTKDFLSEEMLDQYDALFREALDAVAGDPLRLYRVEKNRLSVRWVRLKRAAMLKKELDPQEVTRFFTDWRAFNMSRIDEWCNFETTHRALLDGKWRGVEYFEHWTGEDREIL